MFCAQPKLALFAMPIPIYFMGVKLHVQELSGDGGRF